MNLEVSQTQKEELSLLMQQEAFKEGWGYSSDDVDFYYDCPQNTIYSVKVNHQLAGCVILHRSLSQFDNKPIYSAGLFLVANEYRGKKIVGPYLWQHAITQQIEDDSLVCFHAVPRAVDYYGRLGYSKTALVDRYLTLKQINAESLKTTADLFENGTLRTLSSYEDITDYNDQLFSKEAGRGLQEFIHQWIKRPDAIIVGYYSRNTLQGYGVVTQCKQVSAKTNYRLSPLYANTAEIAALILKGLLALLTNNHFNQIELNTLATAETEFGNMLQNMGFIEGGTNTVVCNKPSLINKDATVLQHVFCSIPLEYPHEIVTAL